MDIIKISIICETFDVLNVKIIFFTNLMIYIYIYIYIIFISIIYQN